MILASAHDLPAPSAWLYFVFHLIASVSHFCSVVLLLASWGRQAGLRWPTRVFGIMAHGGAVGMHAVFGTIGFFNWRIRAPDGTVPWWFLIIMGILAIGLPMYLLFAQRDVLVSRRRRDEEVPE